MLYFGPNKLVWEIKWRVIKTNYQWCEWITYCQAWGHISLLSIECGQRFLEIILKWWLISCKRKYYCYFRFNRLLEFMNIFILFYVIKIKLNFYFEYFLYVCVRIPTFAEANVFRSTGRCARTHLPEANVFRSTDRCVCTHLPKANVLRSTGRCVQTHLHWKVRTNIFTSGKCV